MMRAGQGIVRAGEGSVASRTKGEGGGGVEVKEKPKFAITFSSINKYRNK